MKKIIEKMRKFASSQRFQMMIAMLFVSTVSVFAQNFEAGTTAITGVTTEIAKYIPIVTKLCYAIAGVVAIIGAISVYIAMNNDEQDVKKKIMITVGACIFLIAAATALPKFFGQTNSATSELMMIIQPEQFIDYVTYSIAA